MNQLASFQWQVRLATFLWVKTRLRKELSNRPRSYHFFDNFMCSEEKMVDKNQKICYNECIEA